MTYNKPRVERCIRNQGYDDGWVVIVDRGAIALEVFQFDTWRDAVDFAFSWVRVMGNVLTP